MKKINIVLILLSLCLASYAQDKATVETDKFHMEHEFSVGIGDPIVDGFYTGSMGIYFDPVGYSYDWFGKDTYTGKYIASPSISAGYMLRLKKWLWLGGQLNYFNANSVEKDLFTDEVLWRNYDQLFSIIPTVRFSYLNKKYVTLYSSVGLGMSVNVSKQRYSDNNYSMNFSLIPAFQLTYIGISVGHKFYGIAELGFGNKGLVHAGIGYRFGNK